MQLKTPYTLAPVSELPKGSFPDPKNNRLVLSPDGRVFTHFTESQAPGQTAIHSRFYWEVVNQGVLDSSVGDGPPVGAPEPR